MIGIGDFEEIVGIRWGAHVGKDGATTLSKKAPENALRQLGIIGRVVMQGPFKFSMANLAFQNGRVIVRRSLYGLFILICEDNINVALVDALFTDESGSMPTPGIDSGGATSSGRLSLASSSMSMVHYVSMDTRPIPREVIEELLDLYTTFLGPLARTLSRKLTKANGIDIEAVTVKDWSNLLNILASKITDESKHEDFLDRAVVLKTRFA